MKTLKFIFAIFFLTFIISCNNDNEMSLDKNQESLNLSKTLKEPTLIGNEILLPEGTNWKFTDESHGEVDFTLPEGFEFLLFNERTNELRIAPVGGGYSCTCSGDNSCTTFYNKDLGYGCLQSSCSGSCTGKNSKLSSEFTVEGILYTANDNLDADFPKHKASLSNKGKELLFEIPEFQNEIKRTYDVIYKYSSKPDFSDKNLIQKVDSKKYTFAKTHLYGFDLALLIPNDSNLNELMPNLRKITIEDGPTSCSCSGGSEGGTCKLEKKGLLGYVAYYCNGCTTCTMN